MTTGSINPALSDSRGRIPWFHLLLRDFQGTILAGLAVIGGVAFLVIRRRRRRQIARLPDGPEFPGFEG